MLETEKTKFGIEGATKIVAMEVVEEVWVPREEDEIMMIHRRKRVRAHLGI